MGTYFILLVGIIVILVSGSINLWHWTHGMLKWRVSMSKAEGEGEVVAVMLV
jgi:hypothetical protein